MLHELTPTRRTLHGHWSRDLAPVLTIDPGDTVRMSCLDAMWVVGRPGAWPWARFEPRVSPLDDGHALTGPVYVRGARPGQMLEVRIGAVVPGDWAWTYSGPPDEVARAVGLGGAPYAPRWEVDPAAMVATDPKGRRVPLRPFMGVMGVAPDEPGVHSTTPPRKWGGNMDCKELVAGSTLYLPVGVEGALFSAGDGHGAQGDGEVCGNAIEIPVTRLDLTFGLRDDLPAAGPLARTEDPKAWVTFGFDADLNVACRSALSAMLDLTEHLHGVSRQEAIVLASVAADLRITQIVNRSQGVHCVLRDDAVEWA
ncbi:MAG TPA: acetamidase/formamidase family protein [Tepidisphaeraceae bacterium]|nr:acetamidase/formamidase family protein [Tepidisphaeraceae bacterium]